MAQRNKDGSWKVFNGNEIAILFAGTSAFLAFIFNLKDNPITDISGRNSEITISINENDYDKLKIICQQQDIEIDGIKE